MIVARRRTRTPDADESGFTLVYVTLVAMLIMIAVGSMLVITANNLVPARTSQDSQAAYEAANAGVQDALAFLNSSSGCPHAGTRCDTALGVSKTNTRTGSDVLAGSGETFTWSVANNYITDQAGNTYLRITSTGTAGNTSKTLVADVQGVNGVLDYEYYSTYETVGSNDINAANPSRTIPIDCTTANTANTSTSALTFTCGSSSATATWNGASATSGSTSDSVCDRLWYDSSTLDGSTGKGRSYVEGTSGIAAGSDWREAGSVAVGAGNTSASRDAPCQVAFNTGMSFDGPVYTVDAPLISRGTPTGAGPTFSQPFNTAWSSTSSPAAPLQPYRPDPFVGSAVNGNLPSTRSNPQTFSSTFNPSVPANACIFYGPTRVYLDKTTGTAVVTSPQTSSSNPAETLSTDSNCYKTSLGTGRWRVAYKTAGNGILYVKNLGTSSNFTTTGQTATDPAAPTTTDDATSLNQHTALYLTNSSSAGSLDKSSLTDPSDTACSSSNTYVSGTTCNWSNAWKSAGSSWTTDGTPGWTKYSSGTTCPNNGADRLQFECDFNGGSVGTSHDLYGIYRNRVYNQLTSNTFSTNSAGPCGSSNVTTVLATSQQLICLLQDFLAPANSSGQTAAAAPSGNNQHRYVAQLTNTTTSTTTQPAKGATAPSSPITDDPFFTDTTGTGAQETATKTTKTFTVYRETSSCSLLGLGGLCVGSWVWGGDTAQFQVRISQTIYSNLTSGVPSTSYFPNTNDVTQYTTGTGGANGSYGPGDAYVEGTFNSGIAVLSDHSTVVTGPLLANDTSPTYGAILDTLGDVHVYNPVQCLTPPTVAGTPTAGFCPNDLTGLYTGGLVSNGALAKAHPAMQYCNMLTGLTANNGNPNSCSVTATGTGKVSEIDAAVVAQGGSFGNYNADRGVSLGTLNLKGGLYQLHRGELGVQWELQSSDATNRATSGATLQMTYVNLQSLVPYVPTFQGGSVSRYWNVVSVSSGTS